MLKRHLRRLLKHGFWILLSLVVLRLVRTWVPESALRSAIDVGGNFLQTFGGVYGVLLGFIVFVVWGQHNEAQVAIEKEANSLLALYRLLGWFRAWPQRDSVRHQLLHYTHSVPKAHSANPEGKVDANGLIDATLSVFLAYRPADSAEERLWDHALGLFHQLDEAREHRITVANLRLPEGLKWFVIFGGGMCVAMLEFLWVDSFTMHAIMVAGMTWVVVATTSIILDLDDPYTGDFIVDWGRFYKTAKQMELTQCEAHTV